MRTLDRAKYELLKAATRRLVRACGGVEGAACETRVAKSQLSLYCSLDHPEAFMPIDVVMDLEAACGQGIVTRVMANKESGPARETDPMALASKIGAELGDVHRAILEAVKDGQIDNHELERIIKETADVMRVATVAHDELSKVRTARRQCVELAERRTG